MFYYGKVIEKAQSMNTWTEKLFAFIKGPGWFPGTPRLGDPMGVPEIQVREKYNPKVAGWINVYTVLHFVLVFFAFDDLGRYNIVSWDFFLFIGNYMYLHIIGMYFSEYVTIERISNLCFSLLDLDLYRYGKRNFESTKELFYFIAT